MDASVFNGEDSFSIGMIIRDHAGVFIRGKTMRFAGKVAVAEAEAVGVLEALSWIKEFPSQPVVIETDSLLTESRWMP